MTKPGNPGFQFSVSGKVKAPKVFSSRFHGDSGFIKQNRAWSTKCFLVQKSLWDTLPSGPSQKHSQGRRTSHRAALVISARSSVITARPTPVEGREPPIDRRSQDVAKSLPSRSFQYTSELRPSLNPGINGYAVLFWPCASSSAPSSHLQTHRPAHGSLKALGRCKHQCSRSAGSLDGSANRGC